MPKKGAAPFLLIVIIVIVLLVATFTIIFFTNQRFQEGVYGMLSSFVCSLFGSVCATPAP